METAFCECRSTYSTETVIPTSSANPKVARPRRWLLTLRRTREGSSAASSAGGGAPASVCLRSCRSSSLIFEKFLQSLSRPMQPYMDRRVPGIQQFADFRNRQLFQVVQHDQL